MHQEKTLNEVSTGLHIFEVHMASIGKGFVGLLIFLTCGLCGHYLYRRWRRNRRRSPPPRPPPSSSPPPGPPPPGPMTDGDRRSQVLFDFVLDRVEQAWLQDARLLEGHRIHELPLCQPEQRWLPESRHTPCQQENENSANASPSTSSHHSSEQRPQAKKPKIWGMGF